MATTPDVRAVLLDKMRHTREFPRVVIEAMDALDARKNKALQRAVLAQWQGFFNAGLIAWGDDIENPKPPWFFFTERGEETLKHLSRDPTNPGGYMECLKPAEVGPVAESYITEALATYERCCYKATAVMIGAAAERVVLDLRDVVTQRLQDIGRPQNGRLNDWRIKTVFDELEQVLTDALDRALRASRAESIVKLREEFTYHWPSLVHQIRASRNDAGHPRTIAPVTPEDVHAALLTFPHVARIAHQMKTWVTTATTF